MPEKEYRWIEYHAYEFAGRLLVPKPSLCQKFEESVQKAKNARLEIYDLDRDTAREFVSRDIAPLFQVSSAVIEKRLRVEGIF